MYNIGQILKENRENKKLSLKDVSLDIKTNVEILEAIEEGNIEFFDDDLSYLNYYIKYYFKYLNIEYIYDNEINEMIKEYRNKKFEETSINEINMNINIQNKISGNRINKPGIKLKDYPSITFSITIIILLSIILTVVYFNKDNIFNNSNNNTPTPTPTQPIIIPTPTMTPTPTPVIKEPIDLTITKVDALNYEVRNYVVGEDVNIKVSLNAAQTWIRVLVNNVVSNNPKSQIYPINTEFTVIEKANNDLVVSIHLGIFKDNLIYINDKLLELDDSVKDSASANQVNIIFKGE